MIKIKKFFKKLPLKLIPLFFLASPCVFAKTQTQYFGIQGMINIITPTGGSADADAETLYNKMDVPAKDSSRGPGKAIKTANKEFNLICSNSNARGYICTLVLKKSPRTQLSANAMQYQVTGVEAQYFWKKFFLNNNNEFLFVSEDKLFKIEASENLFLIQFNSNGVN